jgi:oligo-1,6-glucosidase
MVSRFGNDSPEFRDASSKMLTTFIMSMRGTPYYYFGDELAMTNAGFDKIEDYKDMPTLNEYQHQKNIGGDLKKFMSDIKFSCRDNGRTPMQWDSSSNAGFTTGTPWLKTNPNYTNLNVSAQEKDAGSCLNYFRKMVALRKSNNALVYGRYKLLDKDNPDVYAYTRELGARPDDSVRRGKKILVLLNFTNKTAAVNTGIDLSKAKVLIGNYKSTSANGSLQPYEAVIYEL